MRALSLLPFLALFTATARAAASQFKNVVPYIPQSFFFEWNDPNVQLPNPTTAQCGTINIKWSRSAALGPNPIGPYTLLVHTSAYTVPLVIDAGDNFQYNWTVPFPPGTQYEICMFDKNGATGGCQAIYTVYPSQTTGCGNVSLPAQSLNVQGIVANGPISQYGWVDQCTDISLVPKNGTPPFTMLISPALHPPYKVMSNDMSPINWTVSLSWASPFFVSLTDSNGLSWTNGPLHSGGPGGTTACLDTDSQPMKSGISIPIVVGSSVGGLVLGAIAGIVIGSLCVRTRYNKVRRNSSTDSIDRAAYIANQERFKRTEPGPQSPGTNGPDVVGNQYLVEPFLPEGPTSPTHNTMPPAPAPTSAYSNTQSDGSVSGTQPQPAPHVYVVHHDGGGAPVTVFTGGGGVTELPPSYTGRPDDQPNNQLSAGGSNNFEPTDRRPRPGPTPRKSQPGFQ